MSNLGRRSRTHMAAATAAIAAFATLTFGLPSGASSAPSPAAAKPSDDRVAERAVVALKQHPRSARATKGQEFRSVATLRDANGSTHVRLQRTYRGLPVIGGDLVVHQGPEAKWAGVSQTLAAPVQVSIRPERRAGPGRARGRHPGQGHPRDPQAPGRGHPAPRRRRDRRLAAASVGDHLRWPVLRRHPEPVADLCRRADGQGHPPRGEDPDDRRPGQLALQRHGSAPGHTVRLVVPAQGPDPRRHLHDRLRQQDRRLPLPGVRLRLQARHDLQQHRHVLRQRLEQQP